MFLPYKVDVPMARWPLANWAIMLVTIVTSIALFGPLDDYREAARGFALVGIAPPAPGGVLASFFLQSAHFRPVQLVGNILAHDGWFHLAGNMLFLWVFGNAVNAKIGQWQYVLLYFGIGIFEGLVWLVLGPHLPVLGASGAIMGIVGAFLLLFPVNNISSLFMFFYVIRPVEFSAGWLIAFYFIADFYGAIFQRHAGVAYLAHVIGFLAGAGVITALLWWRRLASARGERTLLQVFGWMPENPEASTPITENYLGRPLAAGAPTPPPARRPPPKPRDDSPIPFD